ncbi:nuclease-related domain-containing protein [Bacillus sp. FJAT-49736]|uniref:nuclease-related domain-containing protein n=1 Tax=Bacillus sp. FJAT-49736 TaxID=2833582 RepID=UPI001BC90FFF|nr:nuclease-related domain-containing protein [Bacillus sp. FJAT-49736]MBS4174594.1 NERD domain-containing protein [Bacillus sp. FJAT-49736]
MIVKAKKVEAEILALQALLRRLPEKQSKRLQIEKDLAKKLAGFKGEQSMEYYVSFLPEDIYLIFHHIRLQGNLHHFQMDIFILSPTFSLILEVKHISGKVTFDRDANQLIREYNNDVEVFPDPVLQANHQKLQLIMWLKDKRFPPFPIETLVVMTNPSSLIQFTPNSSSYKQTVLRSTNFISKMNILSQKYKEEKLTKREIRKLSKLLLRNHIPKHPEVLQKYNITQSEVLSGVHCPECFYLPMHRIKGKWICSKCNFSNKNAQKDTLEDYSLLFKSVITNKEARGFLKIDSDSIVQKLLKEMNLPHSGTTKGRVYQLPFNDWD